MRKLTITMEVDNAAFDEDQTQEIGRILSTLADRLPTNGPTYGPVNLHDINGNWVGEARIDAVRRRATVR